MNKFDHRIYNELMFTIMDEEDSLEETKDLVADDITKDVWKKHGKSTSDWAKYAATNNLWYPVTIYKNENPQCYIVFSTEYVEVRFLDERLFENVYMAYKKMDLHKMFLSKIYVSEYYHNNDDASLDLKKDIDMIFTVEGGLSVTTREFIRDEKVRVIEDNVEAAHPVNVSQNWKSIPEYGEYDEISNYEDVIKPGDLLRDIDTSLKSPVAEDDEVNPDSTKENKWLPPDWNKN